MQFRFLISNYEFFTNTKMLLNSFDGDIYVKKKWISNNAFIIFAHIKHRLTL